jgi:diadenylate cyclase
MMAAAFGWRDALDVLLVALVIYRIVTLFRGTRAMQMLVGVGVLVIASFGARQLELHSLSWLLDTLWSFWVVVLVVLFQPELRRALTSLGHAAALRHVLGGGRAETLRVVDEIASVAGSLAERRIGALIVIERGTGLRQYAELGVALDALVSADLLTSLFLPYSPLHDGAAFIRDDRVIAAGCFLPLSRNSQLARHLGTRHRAALGVTEETDAVAVVVSEETGRLSLAVDGGIEALSGADALHRRLLALLGAPTDGVPAFWRGWLRAVRLRARTAGPPSASGR